MLDLTVTQLNQIIGYLPSHAHCSETLRLVVKQRDHQVALEHQPTIVPLTKDQQDKLKDLIEHAILHRTPSDLTKRESTFPTHEWFATSGKGTRFNWRNKSYVVYLIAVEANLVSAFHATDDSVITKMITAVLSRKSIVQAKSDYIEESEARRYET